VRRTIAYGALIGICLLAGVTGPVALGAVSGSRRDARIAGRVLLCNVPHHCLRRRFKVSAINSSGATVASTTTSSAKNAYRLAVAPGHYRLVAKAQELVCRASATATAHRTTRRNITCLVP
jgi:hypothetical protein